MKVYKLRLVMGKVANYDQNGKLKNNVITAKYAGEFELRNMLDDQAWKKLGACEISCVDCYDSKSPSITDNDRMDEVNAEIAASLKAGVKPKTEIDLLKEQIAILTEKVNNPVPVIQVKEKTEPEEEKPKLSDEVKKIIRKTKTEKTE